MGTAGNAAGTVQAIAWMSRSRLLLIVAGLAVVGWGTFTVVRAPTCNGVAMHAGDRCATDGETYEVRRSDDRAVATMSGAVGLALLGGAGARQVQAIRQRRSGADPTGAGSPPPGPPTPGPGPAVPPAPPGGAPYRPFGGPGAP